MSKILSINNLLLLRTDMIFYILAVACFCAFLVVLLWYLLSQKKESNNKQTKSWTIESAKKFLESQNIDIKQMSNSKADANLTATKTATKSTKPATNKVASTSNKNSNKATQKTVSKTEK